MTWSHSWPAGTPGRDAGPSVSENLTASTAAPEDSGASTAELRKAVQAYSDAFLTGDAGAAYGLLSQRCRKRHTSSEFGMIVEAAGRTYGSALPMTSFDADIQGSLARVTYTYDVKAINQDAEPWVREDGKWKEDDC